MKYITPILFVIFISGCSYMENLNETGDTIEKEIDVNAFSSVVSDASYCFYLVTSPQYKVVMTGYDFIMKEVEFTQDGETLRFDHNETGLLQKSKVVKVYLYAPEHKRMTFNAPCEVISEEQISGDALTIVTNGGGTFSSCDVMAEYNSISLKCFGLDNIGNYQFEGATNTLNLYLEGGVTVDAEYLEAQNVTVNHRSIGKCVVWADAYLNVTTFSSGNTYYKGVPLQLEVTKGTDIHFNAKGQVLPMP